MVVTHGTLHKFEKSLISPALSTVCRAARAKLQFKFFVDQGIHMLLRSRNEIARIPKEHDALYGH